MMNKKYLLPIAIVATTVLVIFFITSNPPSAKRGRGVPTTQLVVETKTLAPQRYQVIIESFGTVKPRTKSSLVTQVSGQILSISPNFREGGTFKKGEVLVKLDDRDYRADVKIARAAVFSAQQALAEEKARSKQALTDWNRLANGETPTDLVLRKPQLEAAKASLMSAQAQLEIKELALERSQVIAPFDGRVLDKQVDVGQVVSSNTQLASIYATDYVEIRLPINNNDLALMTLPESFKASNIIDVAFSSTLVGKQRWQGQVIRSEAAIDDSSQQLYVVAQINQPFEVNKNQPVPIKIGQYLTANIAGNVLNDALVVPNNTIYQGSYVYTVSDGRVYRKAVDILWQNSEEAIIANGLSAGDQLVMTSLGQVSSGTKVAILGDQPIEKSKREQPVKLSNKRSETTIGDGQAKTANQAKIEEANL
ncbi:efflux RND transporter periplasmic adaptor subunit [Thalassotalea sp. LPB0316]|uniref:efflux RND transporter periplasmic adaptor subunit n=1 Tax=Thalassotalea sp. LPB0316 TaxID=2769490 RepID=UPI001867595A|nr:efflux RND transporter periplasmic adaptor subunit [Thalassotalea sp. LPB0316]QOL26323.1 efflux RND transporter periplasmic adaptor subunit [Thalassotalea sp. LPB0316]